MSLSSSTSKTFSKSWECILHSKLRTKYDRIYDSNQLNKYPIKSTKFIARQFLFIGCRRKFNWKGKALYLQKNTSGVKMGLIWWILDLELDLKFMYRGWKFQLFSFLLRHHRRNFTKEGKLLRYNFFSKYDLSCKYIFKGLWTVGTGQDSLTQWWRTELKVSKAKFLLSYIITK